jgi:hypothetical protein
MSAITGQYRAPNKGILQWAVDWMRGFRGTSPRVYLAHQLRYIKNAHGTHEARESGVICFGSTATPQGEEPMGEFHEVQTDVGRHVMTVEAYVSWNFRPELIKAGTMFQYMGNRRSSLGGYIHRLAPLHYDSYLGWYAKREESFDTNVPFAFVDACPLFHPEHPSTKGLRNA